MWILVLVAASMLAVTGCNSANQTHTQSKEPVVYATEVSSPDGRRVAVVTHNGEAIEVGPSGGGRRHTVYIAPADGSITTNVYWPLPNLIVFGDGSGSSFEVDTLDVRTHRAIPVASVETFGVSSDGRWIAWSQPGGQFRPNLDAVGAVGVLSINGGSCREVPRPKNMGDTGAFFKRGLKRLFFERGPYNPKTYDWKSGAVGPSRTISVPLASLRRCS